jgi:hypothetical protein
VSVASDHFHPVFIGQVRPCSLASGRRLVQRPVDRDVGEVQADHLVERVDCFFDQVLTRTGCLPLVTPTPQRRLASLAEPSGHVPTAPVTRRKRMASKQSRSEIWGPVTAQWMVGFAPFGQIGGKGRPDGVDDDRVKCKHGTSTGSLGWDTAGFCPVRANDRWIFLPGHGWSTLERSSAVTMAREEVVMAKVKRNGPCPCGSGNKAKRCCYGNERLFDNELVPKELCEAVISDLAGTSKLDMRSLFDQLVSLPELDLSLQVPLPLIRTPHLDRAVRALQDDDGDVFDQELAHVVPLIDDADHRSTLARAVLALRDQGLVPKKLAALAVLELDRETSTFFISSVAESIAVLAGDQRTPSGLLVATR